MTKFKILYVIKKYKNKDRFVYYVNVLRQAEKMRSVSIKTYFFPLLAHFFFLLFIIYLEKNEKRQRLLWMRNGMQIPSSKQVLCLWEMVMSSPVFDIEVQSHLSTLVVKWTL